MDLTVWGFLTVVGSFIGSGGGAYIGAYLKKKGENLATHEDVSNLVAQVSAVTQATKDIEAKISTAVWDRQKRWELKREVLFGATQRVAEIDNALLAYKSVLRTPKTHEPSWNAAFLENGKRWNSASAAFDETKLLVAIVCSKPTKDAFDEFAVLASKVAAGIGQMDAEIYDKFQEDLARKFFAVRAAMRKELEIEERA